MGLYRAQGLNESQRAGALTAGHTDMGLQRRFLTSIVLAPNASEHDQQTANLLFYQFILPYWYPSMTLRQINRGRSMCTLPYQLLSLLFTSPTYP